jgi:hypothetical protein
VSQQINLYNPLFLKKEKHFSARTMVQALAVVLLGIVAVFVSSVLQTRSAEQLAGQYRDQVAHQRDQLVKLGGHIGAAERSKALETEVAQLETEVKLRQATLQAVGSGELGNTTGFSEFLAALGRQALSGVWLTHVQIGDAGNDLFIEGRALRPELMPAYLRALSHEAMMRGRRVTEMKLAAATAKPGVGEPPAFVEFSLAAPLELREPATPAAGRAR